jgi:hypothetical protein
MMILCFLAVVIIRYFIIPITKGIVYGMKLHNSRGIIQKLEKYLFPFYPLFFGIVFAKFVPIGKEYFIDVFVYFGCTLLIFKLLFKTILERIENRIRGK